MLPCGRFWPAHTTEVGGLARASYQELSRRRPTFVHMTATTRRKARKIMSSTATRERRVQLAGAAPERRPAGNAAIIAAELSMVRCRWCNDDLEHCHESLVVHAVGESHCMGANCTTPAELHHMIVDCADFGCTCAETSGLRAADSGTAGVA